MSLILKGIDLPTDGEITVTIEADGDAYPRTIGSSREHYQAIQIPKGHGRLIDADKLRNEFSRTKSGYCGAWEFCDKPEDMQFLIDDEPTILEAEEE